jgi:lysophospholipase L1-like esterase
MSMLMALVAASVLTQSAPGGEALLPGADPKPKMGWLERHEAFAAEARKGGIDVLFLGDSITDFWRDRGREAWDKSIAPLKAANFGLSGDRTQHLLWRLQHGELDGVQPKLTVVMIGTNNIGQTDPETPASAIAGIRAIVKEVRTRVPRTRVLLLGVFPRGETAEEPLRVQVREINAAIRNLDDGASVSYLDLGAAFLDPDGTISRDVMADFLHPTAKGYRIWAEAMQQPLAQLLKEAAAPGR